MEKLIFQSKNGESFFHQDGDVYYEKYGKHVLASTGKMIHELSHQGIYPTIKFDRQYELIYARPNKYVIGPTLHQAFCNLMITLFKPMTDEAYENAVSGVSDDHPGFD
jgi:hypothetical protein